MIVYEKLLDADLDWALQEGSMHFDQTNSVHRALQKLAVRLNALGVEYAVAGAMALFLHGYRRFTEDIDVIVTRETLKLIHEALEGRGYLPSFAGSKNLRDAELGVRIDFIIAGGYPGDGSPRSVAFPNPADASVVVNDVRVLCLEKVVELKLASGLTNPLRLKDLGDVQEMMRVLKLPESLADKVDPFVREKYLEFWRLLASQPPEQE